MMMRNFLPFILLFFVACDFQGNTPTRNLDLKDKIDDIFSKQDLKGTILVYDAKQKVYYSNDFGLAEKGYLPASTFKIANSIIAFESDVLKDENTVMKWDGQKRALPSWEKDMNVREAFQASCLPCYQEVAKNIGAKRMKTYLNKLHYNNMEVSESTISDFWIKGNSHITPFEQIDFMQRLYTKKLPILNTTYDKMLHIFEKEKTSTYTYYGKSGWSENNSVNNGWFVGFVVKNTQAYYFALNAEPIDQNNTSKFTEGRELATREVLKLLQIL
ncbi:class D beta-lactamase [Sphingobacterium bovistauri]|uniref:Beta-lactamase n=1 Tax=Sphingobacterium bovistauri TaxID=2781959 RepID=A0ABS7Z4A4_9SPHI|nr:class D beta-lactamase [Sphingobacterium bovistauri]MCA5004984.1 class D beta-lactamase [Sphingobacterium bovistauri]